MLMSGVTVARMLLACLDLEDQVVKVKRKDPQSLFGPFFISA